MVVGEAARERGVGAPTRTARRMSEGNGDAIQRATCEGTGKIGSDDKIPSLVRFR